jgi:hypothetical protein
MNIAYRPLKQKRDEIRLLDLEAADKLDDPLRATLRHAEIQDAQFTALSYVWGDPVKDRSNIMIKYERSAREYLASKLPGKSGRPTYIHSIGSSLARALRHLRQKYGRITIWTDALCINQEDEKEKDWQVPLMKSIYSEAREVHAWLGPRYDEEAATMRNVNAAFGVANTIWSLAERFMDPSSLISEEKWLEACFTVAHVHQSPDQGQRAWTEFSFTLRRAALVDGSVQKEISSLNTLSQNAYFSRMWILQEMGRARSLTFHFGPKHITHRRILLALSLANSLRDAQDNPKTRTLASRFDTRFLGCLSARTTCMQKRCLRDVLAGAYFSPPPLHEATNPRDIIYARLGLAENPRGITVEYGSSVAEVYTAASRFLLSEGFLEILATFRPYTFQRSITHKGFPSWAYDWSKKGFNSFDKYTASGGTAQRVTVALYSHTNFKHVLTMTGVNIGRVRVTKERFSATVLASGLHKGTIGLGSLRAVSEDVSLAKKEELMQSITRTYLQLGISISDTDIEALFEHRSLPLASFWCWWVHWIASLVVVVEDAELQQPQGRSLDMNVAELLFREDSGALNSTANIGRFGTKAGMLTLVDYQRWTMLLSTAPEKNGTQDSLVIQFAESLFRSAWGMRPALLDSGRIGYVPEDSKPNDEVVIFFGVKAPLVVRKVTKDAYKIIGPAHICGAMQGELMDVTLSGTGYKLV